MFGVTGVLTAAAACGGMYLGAVVYTQWLGLKTGPSVMLLPAYWAHSARLPAAMMLPLQVSTALAAAIPLAVSVLSLVAVFAKPRRELHGSARFANRSEIKKTGLLKEKFQPEDAPDLLVGKYGGQFLRWSSKEFAYLAAPTRSGKGVGIVIPNLLHYRDSVVVYDPKMENFLITAGFRAKHGQEVFLFNPGGRMPEHERNPNAPLVSHRWNPLTYVRRNPTYTYKDALGVAAIMYPDPVNAGGSAMFFAEAARKLFAGLLMYLIETEPERDLSLQENRTTPVRPDKRQNAGRMDTRRNRAALPFAAGGQIERQLHHAFIRLCQRQRQNGRGYCGHRNRAFGHLHRSRGRSGHRRR
nr:type IV secretory system conjugative DNA transfer family protein [Neisseria sicca]